MDNSSGYERRKQDRHEVLLKVGYEDSTSLLADYLSDLSKGGLFIRTQTDFAIGQQIELAVSLPGFFDALHIEAIVRWKREASASRPEEPVGVGVEFVFANEAKRAEVAEWVARLQREMRLPAATSLPPFRVLLVDDSKFVHELFRHGVKKTPSTARRASDSRNHQRL